MNQYISYNLQDLETIVSKQTVEFGTKLANHGIHVDECIRKLRHRSEELKAGVMVDVVYLKEEVQYKKTQNSFLFKFFVFCILFIILI